MILLWKVSNVSVVMFQNDSEAFRTISDTSGRFSIFFCVISKQMVLVLKNSDEEIDEIKKLKKIYIVEEKSILWVYTFLLLWAWFN